MSAKPDRLGRIHTSRGRHRLPPLCAGLFPRRVGQLIKLIAGRFDDLRHRIPSVQNGGEPAVGVGPSDRLAGREIEHMGAAAETVETRFRAGVGVLKAPAAGEAEFGGATLHELDQTLRIARDVIAQPEFRAAMLRLDRQQKPLKGRLFRSAFLGQCVIEIERASGILGCADIEQAQKWMK